MGVASAGDLERPDTHGDGLARAAGIHRLPIPTPFVIGPVNAYLIEDEPLTLIDSGPSSARALHELERRLAALGHRVEDLELLIVSHQHMDHLGLVDVLAHRSGAAVATLDVLAPYLEHFAQRAEADDDFGEALLRRHGVPGDLATALRQVSRAFRGWGAAAHVDRRLGDGEELTLRRRRLEVQHRPGHSPSDTVLWDPERRILIAADHLIAHVSSNPLISRPLREPPAPQAQHRPRALIAYIASLHRTRELPAQLVLSGHGEPILDHRALIDERFRAYTRRAGKLHRLLRYGPRTAYELAQAMWGNVAVTQAYLTLSEVLGHLDLLVEEGRAREHDDGELATFEALDLP